MKLLPTFVFILVCALPVPAQSNISGSLSDNDRSEIIESVLGQKAKAQSRAAEALGTITRQNKNEEVEKGSLELLDDLLALSRSLTLPENRILIQASAAEFLWQRDEKRARSIFDEATSNLVTLINSSSNSEDQSSILTSIRSYLRGEMLRIASARDLKLALDFLRATRRTGTSADGYKSPDEDQQLELRLSAQMAGDDPKRALQIAEESLEKGISTELVNLLIQLRKKDREAADKLLKAVLTRLRTADLLTDGSSQGALNLLSTAIHQLENTTANTSSPAATPLMDKQSTRELMALVVKGALTVNPQKYSSNPSLQNNANILLWSLRAMRREVEKYAPELFPSLQVKLKEYYKSLDPENRNRAQFYDFLEEGDVEGALGVASNAPSGSQIGLFYEAAYKVMERGDFESARKIINRISEAKLRDRMFEELDRRALIRAASEGKLEQVRDMLSKGDQGERAIATIVEIAKVLAKKGDTKGALTILSEAENLVEGPARSMDQFSYRIQLAEALGSVGGSKNSKILDAVINQLNELISATLLLDPFNYQLFIRNEEFILGQRYTLLSGVFGRCLQALTTLAQKDFSRARSHADKFARPEIRALAQLAVLQGVLQSNNK